MILNTVEPQRHSWLNGYATDAEVVESFETKVKKSNPFIEANTKEVGISHLKNDCIVPVFSKDNELTISHQSFIETVADATNTFFRGETVGFPDIRVSHIIKGRIPEAIHKPASQLLESDKTIYYERMMFCIEIPTVWETVNGNRLNLTVGGVRAYNHMNLYSRKSMEKFKVFIGFKNLVCCNMCVSTDGLMSQLEVSNVAELFGHVLEMFHRYNPERHLQQMKSLGDTTMTEHQFCQVLGRMRLYQALPQKIQREIPRLLITDTQINSVAKAYISDDNFRANGSEIDMWRFYNLLTGANKSSYIDSFLDRSLNATEIASGIASVLHGDNQYSWFID